MFPSASTIAPVVVRNVPLFKSTALDKSTALAAVSSSCVTVAAISVPATLSITLATATASVVSTVASLLSTAALSVALRPLYASSNLSK